MIDKNKHVVELLPSYALGILSDQELEVVENHLSSCGQCRGEFSDYSRVVEELPASMVVFTPPASLKKKVLLSIHSSMKESRKARGFSLRQRLTSVFQQMTPAWGMVSLVLVLVLGISNLLLWQRLSAVESSSSKSLLTISLQGTALTPQATGLLVISKDGRHGTLVVDGLPALDEAHQYQLWLIYNGKRDSGGVFAVDQEGYGSLWIESPQPLAGYSAFGVTIEPAGGSSGPTGNKVMGGELSG